MGVTCFTEDCTNLLMWSHYAENHTGFCLEFDASNEFFSNVRKVDYIPSPTVVSARSLLCSTNLQRWGYHRINSLYKGGMLELPERMALTESAGQGGQGISGKRIKSRLFGNEGVRCEQGENSRRSFWASSALPNAADGNQLWLFERTDSSALLNCPATVSCQVGSKSPSRQIAYRKPKVRPPDS